MRLAFVCDFDGTVSPTDVGAALVGRFTTDRGRVAGLVERWRAGEIGTRDVIEGECATLRVSEARAPRMGGQPRDLRRRPAGAVVPVSGGIRAGVHGVRQLQGPARAVVP